MRTYIYKYKITIYRLLTYLRIYNTAVIKIKRGVSSCFYLVASRARSLTSGRSGRSSGPFTPARLAAALAAALVRRFLSKIPMRSTSAKCVLSRVVIFAATPSWTARLLETGAGGERQRRGINGLWREGGRVWHNKNRHVIYACTITSYTFFLYHYNSTQNLKKNIHKYQYVNPYFFHLL